MPEPHVFRVFGKLSTVERRSVDCFQERLEGERLLIIIRPKAAIIVLAQVKYTISTSGNRLFSSIII